MVTGTLDVPDALRELESGKHEKIIRIWGDRLLRSLPSTSVADFDDTCQEMRQEAVRVARKFDPAFGVQFSTYLFEALRRHCHSKRKRAWFRKRTPAKDVSVFYESPVFVASYENTQEQTCMVKEAVSRLMESSQVLFYKLLVSDNFSRILIRIASHGCTRDMGADLGVSPQRISRFQKEVKRVCKECLETV